MKKFIAGVATTFGVLYLCGVMYEEGKKDGKAEVLELMNFGMKCSGISNKNKEEG